LHAFNIVVLRISPNKGKVQVMIYIKKSIWPPVLEESIGDIFIHAKESDKYGN